MATTVNPFADDAEKAEVFEQGYLAGFQDPLGQINFLPLAPDLLAVFQQGATAGRSDAAEPPSGDSSKRWVGKSELAADNDESREVVTHGFIEAFFELTAHVFRRAAFGLAGLVATVLSIEGNVSPEQLQPLEDDFSQKYGGPDSDTNVSYVAVCSRTDHSMLTVGATADRYWIGTVHSDFAVAINDALQHGHSEAGVARCSLTDKTCGLVWLATAK